jgi:hypothetical protein
MVGFPRSGDTWEERFDEIHVEAGSEMGKVVVKGS